jgi:hypothetical protein
VSKFQIYLIFNVVIFHTADYEEISEIIINNYNNFHDRSNYFDKSDNNSDDGYSLYNFFPHRAGRGFDEYEYKF